MTCLRQFYQDLGFCRGLKACGYQQLLFEWNSV
jgi:hypothetical protein